MKKWIKELAVDYMEMWDSDPGFFVFMSFLLAFSTAICIGLGIGLVAILVNYPTQGMIILGIIVVLFLVPAAFFAYGKHVKANE
jgi:hypothetical protein